MTSKTKHFLIIATIFFLSGCGLQQLKSPVMPVWDVAYTVPIVNRTEVVSERIKGVSGIFIDSSTNHLLLKFDSTRMESKPLDEIFGSKIKYEDQFSFKPQQVDTIIFESFVSDDSVFLEEFHLYKGELNYQVFNYLDRKVDLNVTIPGFTKTTNVIDTLKFQIVVPPFGSASRSIDLKDYKYRQTPNPFGGSKNGFYIKGYAKVDAGYSGDSISTKVEIKNLGFNYLKGKVKPYEDEIKPKTIALDVDKDAKDILPKVQVYGAKLIVTPNTTARNLKVRLKDFEIIGSFKTSSQKKNLKIKNQTVLDTTIFLDQPSFVFNLDDVDINDFLNPQVPDSITYKGKIIINPNYESVDLSLPDTLTFNVQFQVYSIFKIDSVSRTDTFSVQIDEEFKKQIDKFNEGKITLNIENGFPLGFQVTGYLLDSLNRKLLYFTKERGGNEPSDTVFSIVAGQIDLEGKVIIPAKQIKIISITKEEAEKIKNAKKAVLKVLVYTTQGKKVIFRSQDKILFKVSTSINIRVGGS
jgi:hypothetical protein